MDTSSFWFFYTFLFYTLFVLPEGGQSCRLDGMLHVAASIIPWRQTMLTQTYINIPIIGDHYTVANSTDYVILIVGLFPTTEHRVAPKSTNIQLFFLDPGSYFVEIKPVKMEVLSNGSRVEYEGFTTTTYIGN